MKTNHAEAFCFMQYKCRECNLTEMLYNSRDGVTPFIIRCLACGGTAQHVNWKYDFRIKDLRIFINMTKERAREIAKTRLAIPVSDAPIPPKGSVEYREMVESITDSIYHEGTAPDIVSLRKVLNG